MEERNLIGREMIKEFKKFLMQGNVVALAVGVIIGGAFRAIVDSLIADIIMPIIGIILGGVDFTQLAVTVGGANLTYGNFIQAILNFVVIGFIVFLFSRAVEKFNKKEEEAAPAAPSNEEVLLGEIRDLLKK